MRQENKILNNAFKNIIKYILPDDYRIAFTLVENINQEKVNLMKKIANSRKYKRSSMIQNSDFNKIETFVLTSNNPVAFIDTLKKEIFEEFHTMYMKCKPIINDLIKIQNDINEF